MIIILILVQIANTKIFYNKSKLKETQYPNFKIFINVLMLQGEMEFPFIILHC